MSTEYQKIFILISYAFDNNEKNGNIFLKIQ